MPSLRRKIRKSGIPMPDFPLNPGEPVFLIDHERTHKTQRNNFSFAIFAVSRGEKGY
jgi:hypothetical protein